MSDDVTLGELHRLQIAALDKLDKLTESVGANALEVVKLKEKVAHLEEDRQTWSGWVASAIGAVLLTLLHWLVYGTNGNGR